MSGDSAANKDKRYDRQIRIWGVEGQQRLESAKVALLNCGPTGSETLKNLVLGGIASFTIVDGNKVEPRDLGNNFLVTADSLGQPRAQVVTNLLQEMNDSVAGSYCEDSPEALMAGRPEFFDSFDLVIATQMRMADLASLDDLCRSKGIKLLVARSYGLVGWLRASVAEHQVVESKPDAQVDDLRIAAPWSELLEFARSFDLGSLDSKTHSHIPYAVLLLQAAEQWRAAHGGTPPTSSKERAEFKALLRGMKRTNSDGIPLDEENFDEAVKVAFQAWTPPSIPAEVTALLKDAAAVPEASSSNFWVMVAALKEFVAAEGQGCLPLDSNIPDMHASTELYLQLQRLYRAKADSDAAAVEAHARTILARLGRPADSLPPAELRLFCKNARNIRVVRCRTLTQEASAEGGRGAKLVSQLASEGAGSANAALMVLLRAADRFHATHGRYPGAFTSELENDVPLLKAAAMQVLSDMGAAGAPLQDDYVHEMCRFGASELHVVAAVVGGMAAQEAIKLITRQFVPFGGSLIYNGMASTTSVLDL